MISSNKHFFSNILKYFLLLTLSYAHPVMADWVTSDFNGFLIESKDNFLALNKDSNAYFLASKSQSRVPILKVFKQKGGETTWSTDQNIIDSGSQGGAPLGLFPDDSNNFRAVSFNSDFLQNPVREVFILKAFKQEFSLTNSNWSNIATKEINPNNFLSDSKFEGSSSGNIIGVSHHLFVYALTPTSKKWKSFDRLDTTIPVESSKTVAIQENKSIIAWATVMNNSTVLNSRRYYFDTDDLQTIDPITYPPGRINKNQVVIDAAGNATLITHIARNNNTGYDAFVSYLSASGNGWSNFVKINSPDSNSDSSCIAVNRNGDVMVAWHETDTLKTAKIKLGVLEESIIVFKTLNPFLSDNSLSINTHGHAVLIITTPKPENKLHIEVFAFHKAATEMVWKKNKLETVILPLLIETVFASIKLNDQQTAVALWQWRATVGGITNKIQASTFIGIFPQEKLPSTDAINPSSGPASGGTPVIITGNNFKNTIAVDFGPRPALEFHVDSDTQISAITPIGIGTVQVSITTKSGVAPFNGIFTYFPSPFVEGLKPAKGPSKGGNEVIIEGELFNDASKVKFGNKKALSFHVDSENQITAVAPPGTGKVEVFITTPLGTSPANMPDDVYTYKGSQVLPPTHFRGKTVNDKFLTQSVFLNHLTWNPSLDKSIEYYQILRDGVKLAQIDSKGPFEYNDDRVKGKIVYTLFSVTKNGHESEHLHVILGK
ncbi:MAG: IPT/TIG domain-containing protein [Parachlamydiaceae bacterium]|nr:IPT/TIG domain-containing protein [Parachlamydiaceae bacterium]